jgi:hypothetical protein
MHWNYRVVKKDGYLGIHEAYYGDDNEVCSVTVDPISPREEDIDELRRTLEWIIASLEKPVLDFEIVGQPKKPV